MATLIDVPVISSGWTNIHTTRSLLAGAFLTAQNKTSQDVLFFVGTTAPTDNSGMIIKGSTYDFLEINPAAGEYLFVKALSSTSVIGVQV